MNYSESADRALAYIGAHDEATLGNRSYIIAHGQDSPDMMVAEVHDVEVTLTRADLHALIEAAYLLAWVNEPPNVSYEIVDRNGYSYGSVHDQFDTLPEALDALHNYIESRVRAKLPDNGLGINRIIHGDYTRIK